MTEPATGLVFYPKSHRYKLDGDWVSSVTTLLGEAIPKPALTQWAANTVAEYVVGNFPHVTDLVQGRVVDELGDPADPYQTLRMTPRTLRDQAGERGTDVHTFAERISLGQTVDVPEHLVGHVRSVTQFLDDWQIDPLLVEARVGSRAYGYAGTLDLLARHHSQGAVAVFDYKTSKSGVRFETAFQLAAYAFADFHGENGDEVSMGTYDVAESYAVHVRDDGYTVYPMEYGPQVFEEFLDLARSAKILKRAEGDWRTPGTGYVGVPVTNDLGETA